MVLDTATISKELNIGNIVYTNVRADEPTKSVLYNIIYIILYVYICVFCAVPCRFTY